MICNSLLNISDDIKDEFNYHANVFNFNTTFIKKEPEHYITLYNKEYTDFSY